MDFYALLDEIVTLLRRRDRVSYRALKLQLDDDYLRALKNELVHSQPWPGTCTVGMIPSSFRATYSTIKS